MICYWKITNHSFLFLSHVRSICTIFLVHCIYILIHNSLTDTDTPERACFMSLSCFLNLCKSKFLQNHSKISWKIMIIISTSWLKLGGAATFCTFRRYILYNQFLKFWTGAIFKNREPNLLQQVSKSEKFQGNFCRPKIWRISQYQYL